MKISFIIFLSIVFIFTLYFLVMYSTAMYTGGTEIKDTTKQIAVTGHRGAAGLAPENTLAAIKAGLEQNVNRIEIDVHQTKDKQIVVLHDPSIDRTTSGKGLVKDMTFREIRKYSAGSWFDEKFESEKIPTLDEVMLLINGKATLVIEIKAFDNYYQGIEKRVIDIIHKHKANNWVAVCSFDDSVLVKIHELDKKIVLHKLFILKFPFLKLFNDGKLRIVDFQYYDFVDEFSVYYPFANRRLIDKVHSLNKKINVWTVDDTTKINRLINLGIDGIITNHPENLNKKMNK
ncbi:MAG: hypothetical protein L3J74_09600 [Bacteroidales bacterium]|nr:hypothetical protein [Bacteroidales bacterium]